MSRINQTLKIRSRVYQVYYRTVIQVEDYESVILSIIKRSGNSMLMDELGIQLGFATKNDSGIDIQKDESESFLLDKFLSLLIAYNLVIKNSETNLITITEWGELALEKNEKYKFYDANITLPEFFNLTSSEDTKFDFKSLGFDLDFKKKKELPLGDYLEKGAQPNEVYNSSLKDEFFNSSSLEEQDYRIDHIDDNPLQFIREDVDFEAEIDHLGNLKIYLGELEYDLLSKIINHEDNIEFLDDLVLRCTYSNFLDSTSTIDNNNIAPFISILDWTELIPDERIIWDSKFIDLIIPEALYNERILVTKHCDLRFLEAHLKDYQDFWEWRIVTERMGIDFVCQDLSKFPWDILYIIEHISEEKLELHLTELSTLVAENQNELALLTPRISNELLNRKYKQIGFDLNHFLRHERKGIEELVLNCPSYDWNWKEVISKANLQPFLDRYEDLQQQLIPCSNQLLEKLIRDEESRILKYSNTLLERVIKNTNSSEFTKIGASSKITSNHDTLRALNDHELIFWGNEKFNGFECNRHVNWSFDLIKLFIERFNHQESVNSLSSSITTSDCIEQFPELNWNWSLISQNPVLISSNKFIRDYTSKLDFLSVARFIKNDLLLSDYDYIRSKIKNESITAFSRIIADRLPLLRILEKEKANTGDLDILNWVTPISNSTKEELNEVVNQFHDVIPHINNIERFSEEFTRHFSLEETLSNSSFSWDWKKITTELLEKGISDEELETYSDKLVWHLIIESHYSQEDLLLRNKLNHIKGLVSHAKHENRMSAWTSITKKYPIYDINNAIESTINDEHFYWDWNVISSSNKIDTKLKSLIKFEDLINWDLLSENPIWEDLLNIRNKELYRDFNSWKNKVIEYLSSFKHVWDFKKLSQVSAFNWQYSIIEEFEDKWDWDILSSENSRLLSERNAENRNTFQYSEFKLKKFENYINWKIISKRTDLQIPEKFIEKHVNKDWDWAELSSNPMFIPSIDFLKKNHNLKWSWENFSKAQWLKSEYIVEFNLKPWNWKLISENDELFFDKDLVSILSNKPNVNWNKLVHSPNLVLDIDTISILSTKGIDQFWDLISKSSILKMTNEMLGRFRLNWNWKLLVEYDKININDIELLEKYESSLPWRTVSSNHLFQPSIEILSRFKDNLQWKIISKNLELNRDVLRKFKEYLDWKIISRNSQIQFDRGITEEFIDVLDIYYLKNNASLTYDAEIFLNEYLEQNAQARFVYKLMSKYSIWSGNVYHFTHITNAIQVINQKKILSRNKALESDFADAAGNVVSRRGTAHDYARFYFRPQTPTQFYNECLGKDHNSKRMTKVRVYSEYLDEWGVVYGGEWIEVWKSYFPQAMDLGLPKCPIPVFFKFDLNEVLHTFPELCEISDGNMQKTFTLKGTIEQMIDRFSFDDVYSSIKRTSDNNWRTYLDKSQQEFLVLGELDFSKLKYFEIIVRTEEDKNQLLELIDNKNDFDISVDKSSEHCFHNSNPKIDYEVNKDRFYIYSSYEGDGQNSGELWLKTTCEYDITSGSENILYKEGDKLVFYPSIEVSFKEEGDFISYFKDKVTDKPEWEIVKHHIRLDTINN